MSIASIPAAGSIWWCRSSRAWRPNGICFSPDYTKLYVIRGGGIHVGDIAGTKLTNLREFTDCMVDGMRCGPDGMRADKAGNIWASSARRWAIAASRCGIRPAS